MDTPAFFREARELNTQLEYAFQGLEPYAGSSRRAAHAREALRQQGLQLRYALGTEKPADLPDPFRVNDICIQASQLLAELTGHVHQPARLTLDDLPNAPERHSRSLREAWEGWAAPRRNRQPIHFGSAEPLAQAAS